MAILPIRIWGDPILTRRAVAVDRISSRERKLIADMIDTMLDAEGAGLAAPQVGVGQRIFVFRRGDGIHALINPKILVREGQRVGTEGCLSIPGVQAEVERARRVIISGRNEKNRNVQWECEDGEEQGRAATCVQHELDHLDGILYLSRAIPESISWIMEEEDEEGQPVIALQPTTSDEIREAYRRRSFPPGTYVPDNLRRRVEREG